MTSASCRSNAPEVGRHADMGTLEIPGKRGGVFRVSTYTTTKGDVSWWLDGPKGSRWYARPFLDPNGDTMEVISMSGSAGRPLLDGFGQRVTVQVRNGRLALARGKGTTPTWLRPIAARVEFPNPHLMLITAGNPSGAAISRVKDRWCRFHQRDEFDGRTTHLSSAIAGVPETVFALGKCVGIDLGMGEQDWRGSVPMLCYDIDDEALWILSPRAALNLGTVKSSPVEAIIYDPIEESGKEAASYRHDFDRPFPTLAPVGDPRRCRAALLDGGRYRVTDWIHD